ncbi:MAG: Holliday junction resolvase RuvX [Bacilli bacterium]|nr:Holliday junction resolvase RuvX [Bacilli bacterium]
MRYLGLDLGTKTLGVSISDTTLTIANSLTIIRFNENDYEAIYPELKQIIDDYEIVKIVLGFPKNMNNTVGDRGNIALQFKDTLVKWFGIEVVMQDERLSTVEATNYLLEADMSRKKRKKKIDKIAANIILQTYLDRRKD